MRKLISNKEYQTQTYKGDFFPYGEGRSTYWVGYFSSRPWLKYLTRYAGRLFQVFKNLATVELIQMKFQNIARVKFSSLAADFRKTTETFGYELGVAQHHDAITGTAKQSVTEDYYGRLKGGVRGLAGYLDLLLGNSVNK
jgi:hypothetical protein